MPLSCWSPECAHADLLESGAAEEPAERQGDPFTPEVKHLVTVSHYPVLICFLFFCVSTGPRFRFWDMGAFSEPLRESLMNISWTVTALLLQGTAIFRRSCSLDSKQQDCLSAPDREAHCSLAQRGFQLGGICLMMTFRCVYTAAICWNGTTSACLLSAASPMKVSNSSARTSDI